MDNMVLLYPPKKLKPRPNSKEVDALILAATLNFIPKEDMSIEHLELLNDIMDIRKHYGFTTDLRNLDREFASIELNYSEMFKNMHTPPENIKFLFKSRYHIHI